MVSMKGTTSFCRPRTLEHSIIRYEKPLAIPSCEGPPYACLFGFLVDNLAESMPGDEPRRRGVKKQR